MLIQKPLFYLLIFSLFLNISSCKKVFDKDYYKDCVGEDKVSGDAIAVITSLKLNYKLGRINNEMFYYLFNSIQINHSDSILNRITVVKRDSMGVYVRELKKMIAPGDNETLSQIALIDTLNHTLIGIRYYFHEDIKHSLPVSNQYNVKFNPVNNELIIFYERKDPSEKDLIIQPQGCLIVVNQNISSNTKLNLSFYQRKCRK